MDLTAFRRQSASLKKENREFFRRLKLRPPPNLDNLFSDAHDAVFKDTDCLACANCCKTTSPVFTDRDIERAARHLRIRPGAFTERYLRLDEENDYVLRVAPCPFLGDGNLCSIYASRPAACSGYPHTNRKKMHQILDLTYRNTLVCPAVLKVVEKLKKETGRNLKP